jgi:hypothetical protein
MKNIIKVSKLFNRKIAQVTSQVYHKFVQLNNMAQSLAIDVYDEMSDSFTSSAQMLSQKCLLAADKIYRKGMSADEIKSTLSSLSSILSKLMIDPSATDGSKKELSSFKSLMSSIIPVDVPPQSHVSNMLSRQKKFEETQPKPGDSRTPDVYDEDEQNMSVEPPWSPGSRPDGSYVTSDEDDGGWDTKTYPR